MPAAPAGPGRRLPDKADISYENARSLPFPKRASAYSRRLLKCAECVSIHKDMRLVCPRTLPVRFHCCMAVEDQAAFSFNCEALILSVSVGPVACRREGDGYVSWCLPAWTRFVSSSMAACGRHGEEVCSDRVGSVTQDYHMPFLPDDQ